jgi:hypothetical protein
VGDGFGELCTTGCPAGEICVFMDAGASEGICLKECATPDQPCAVPDERFFSGCSPYVNSELGSVTVCMIFCEFAGKTYPCPNSTDYRCKAYGAVLSVCVPR